VFRSAITGKRRVVILGAGLIGCEFANDLLGAGFTVAVIDPAPWPLGRFIPEPAAQALRTGLAERGAEWHLGTVVETLHRSEHGYRITLADGAHLQADVVLSAVGLRPSTLLALEAGLRVEHGIAVDKFLQTSHSDIYALVDCAEVEGLVLPFVMPIMHAARALAKTLVGNLTPLSYPAMPVVVKTPAHPVVIAPPAVNAVGEWHWEPVGIGVRALFRDPDGRLLGYALTGNACKEKQALTKELPPMLA
jgi:rubredoxin-NAD+ reductase